MEYGLQRGPIYLPMSSSSKDRRSMSVGVRKSCRDHSKTVYMIKAAHRGLEKHWSTMLRLKNPQTITE